MMIVSCESQRNQEDSGILPVEVSEEIESFFRTHLPKESHSQNVGFSLTDKTQCIVIENMAEFKEKSTTQDELPDIDFDAYTLILGRMVKGTPGYLLKSQAVYLNDDATRLRVVYKAPDGASSPIMTYYNFWGVYPKLPNKPVILDLVVN